ncbi:MAG: hypothetical protein SCJ97_05045 [Bacillota bacterium]|nr:hypothetical protein [Bacillota bacterium]
MSRLESAREKKKKQKVLKRQILLFFIVLALILSVLAFTYRDQIFNLNRQPAADLIDMERSVAVLDIFDLTYVWIFLKDGVDAGSVTANGENLAYNGLYDRWETVFSDYREGDTIILVITDKNDESRIQEVEIIIRKL